jgi:hypothetical protein
MKMMFFASFVVLLMLQLVKNMNSQGFEMIFPKDGDILIQSNKCYGEKSKSVCSYPLYLFGWFPPYKRKHIPYSEFAFPFELIFKINNQTVDKSVFPSFLYRHAEELNVVLWNYEFYLPPIEFIEGRLIKLEILLVDRLLVIHYQHEFTFLLASAMEFYSQNASPSLPITTPVITTYDHPTEEKIHLFLQSVLSKLPNKQKSKNLDYFEIGTSDFDTILHVLENEKKKRHTENSTGKPENLSEQCQNKDCPTDAPHIGISMDAVRNFINRIPIIENTLKIHSAIIPIGRDSLNLTTLDHASFPISHDLNWVIAYYIPNYIVNNHFPGNGFWKGMTEIYRLNPYFLPGFELLAISPSVVQRDYVQSITIPLLFSIIHQYFENGINLFKTDIEGFDTIVMKDVLFYYHYYEELKGELSMKYPCILFFESVFEDLKRDVDLMILLKEVGYKLLHEYPINFDIRRTEPLSNSTEGMEEELSEEMKDVKVDLIDRNTMAINCKCDRSQLHDAWKLLNITFILDLNSNLFNRICL